MAFNGYTKLFSSILASTIWREPNHVRLVWITLLALADKDGVCEASVPGLADLARVPINECEDALQRLSSADPYSRTSEHEGRRIEPIDGGWLLLNHSKYREKMNAEERREYLRIKKAESRARQQSVNNGQQSSTESTQAEAEAEASSALEADPKSKEQQKTQTAAVPLIMSPAFYEKRKAQCAFVGSRLEVPHGLHSDLRKMLGGANSDQELMDWYLDLNAEIETSEEAIKPDVFKWLKARYAKWQVATSNDSESARIDAWGRDE